MSAIRALLVLLVMFSGCVTNLPAAGIDQCRVLADVSLNWFAREPVEAEDAEDHVLNPCTGTDELALMEFKPGAGFIALFVDGDIHGQIDGVVVTRCRDGRALVRDLERETPLCNTLEGRDGAASQ